MTNLELELLVENESDLEKFDESELSDEQHFNAYRTRWIQRLEKRTDDTALKSRLLASLEEAYKTPVSVLSDEDLHSVKDRFLEGVFTPAQFLDELQSLLHNK